jgi:hypothetical protein
MDAKISWEISYAEKFWIPPKATHPIISRTHNSTQTDFKIIMTYNFSHSVKVKIFIGMEKTRNKFPYIWQMPTFLLLKRG